MTDGVEDRWDDELDDHALFTDRVDAGRRLAERLGHLRSQHVVVVGLPRGGVPVALEVARALHAPLDVVLVRKLGVPYQPELAMGAIGEGGVRVISPEIVRVAQVGPDLLARVERLERDELERRSLVFRAGREPVSPAGRVVVVVDDGVATGATARAACQVVRAQGASRVVLAVPVAPVGWQDRFTEVADELVCVATPEPFDGIGWFYEDFSQLDDADVQACLAQGGCDEQVRIDLDGVRLPGHLTVPAGARGVIVFAHGSGSSRLSPRNAFVARVLNDAGLGTLLFDLLTPAEADDRANVFDIELLAGRLAGSVEWLRRRPALARQPVGLFGASTGAAAALWAAATPESGIAAVVSRGGRPDLAAPRLAEVRAPTLLIVGGRDTVVMGLNQQALAQLRCEARLEVVPGAGHLFEERGTLEQAAAAARQWFLAHATESPE